VVIAVRCEGESSVNIVFRQIGKILNNFALGHASSKPAKDIVNGDSQTPNTWLTSAFPGVNGNPSVVAFHDRTMAQIAAEGNFIVGCFLAKGRSVAAVVRCLLAEKGVGPSFGHISGECVSP